MTATYTPAPNHRASLLAGLRTGGVRSTSASVPHTAAPGGSFNVVPRISSHSQDQFSLPVEEKDGLAEMPAQNMPVFAKVKPHHGSPNRALPRTAAVDGPSNRFSLQQSKGMNPNSVPFCPAFTPSMLAEPDLNQTPTLGPMQMMQLEIMRIQAAHLQQYQAEVISGAQRHQQQQQEKSQNGLHFSQFATAGPLTNSFNLRSATLSAQNRRAMRVEQLKPQLGLSDEQVPMTAALGVKFGSRTTSLSSSALPSRFAAEGNDNPIPPHQRVSPSPVPAINDSAHKQIHGNEVYDHLASFILEAASKENPPTNEIGERVHKLRQWMAALGPVEKLMQSNEYHIELLKLTPNMPISDNALREALLKDRQGISVLLKNVINSEVGKNTVLALRGDDAKRFVDLVETVIDDSTLRTSDGALHRQTSQLFVKLCGVSKQLPSSINIQGVVLHDKQPLFGGGFADIYRGSYCGANIAVKRLRVFGHDRDRERIHQEFCREALTWRHLRHPFVLPFLGIDSETFPPFLCMVSPWMTNGTISSHLDLQNKRININRVTFEIAQGLEYIHNQNTVHGDLRGANILLDDEYHVRLADFGLARIAGATTAFTTNRHGSLRWMAPELLSPNAFGLTFERTCATDVYAFACVCIEIYTGHVPFWYDRSDGNVLISVLGGSRPARPAGESGSKAMSDELWHLVEWCWTHDPSERLAMSEVVDLLKGTITSNS